MVRHPLYLLDHWASYISMHGTSARDFTIWGNFNEEAIPWFAKGFEELYIKSSDYDKVIYSIEALMESVLKYAKLKNNNKTILFVPFELFVLEPNPYINQLEKFLNTNVTISTNRVLKKQRVPRPSINAGPQKSIYRRYGLKKYDKEISHELDYQNQLASAKEKSSPEAFAIIERLSKEYEETFGLWF